MDEGMRRKAILFGCSITMDSGIRGATVGDASG